MNTIIWDWNGTLLDDVNLCISSVNVLLRERKLPEINLDTYREVFSFPVQDYYRTLGFDFEKEEFSVPAHKYIDLYYAGFDSCFLQKNATETLAHFKEKGIRQFVLSAMEHEMLENTLKRKGIRQFFEGVAGLTDHYAVSKVEQGKTLIARFNIDAEKTWLIGDTTHDFQVAEEMGVKCILIANGHQTRERLQATGAIIIDSIGELIGYEFSSC